MPTDPNLSVPRATLTARPDHRTPVPTHQEATTMRPYCFEDDDLLDPAALARQLLRSEIHRELADLEHRRDHWRNVRRTITELWFVVFGLAVFGFVSGWWPLAVPVVGLSALALHLAGRTDVSAGRGRELDADIAAAKGRLRGIADGGES